MIYFIHLILVYLLQYNFPDVKPTSSLLFLVFFYTCSFYSSSLFSSFFLHLWSEANQWWDKRKFVPSVEKCPTLGCIFYIIHAAWSKSVSVYISSKAWISEAACQCAEAYTSDKRFLWMAQNWQSILFSLTCFNLSNMFSVISRLFSVTAGTFAKKKWRFGNK